MGCDRAAVAAVGAVRKPERGLRVASRRRVGRRLA